MNLNIYEMNNNSKLKIFLVDDDTLFLKTQVSELNSKDEFDIETFANAELCLENVYKKPDVIIIDYWLNGVETNAMNGEQALDKIKRFNSDIPVVIYSAQEKIDVAVNCMHHRAFDYVVKSRTAIEQLRQIITTIKNLNIL